MSKKQAEVTLQSEREELMKQIKAILGVSVRVYDCFNEFHGGFNFLSVFHRASFRFGFMNLWWMWPFSIVSVFA